MPEKKKRKSRAKKTTKTMSQRVTQTVRVNVGAPKKAGRRQAPLRQPNPPPPPFYPPHPVSASNDKITASLADVTRQLDRLQAQNRQPVIRAPVAPVAQVGAVEEPLADPVDEFTTPAKRKKKKKLTQAEERAELKTQEERDEYDRGRSVIRSEGGKKSAARRKENDLMKAEKDLKDRQARDEALAPDVKGVTPPSPRLSPLDNAGTAEAPPFVMPFS